MENDIKKEIPPIRIESDFRGTTINDKIRDAEMQRIPYIIVIGDKEEKEGTLAVRFNSKVSPFKREDLTNFLTRNGIDTRDLFSSMPTQCPGFSFLGYKSGNFPEAEYIGRNGLHIGVHQDIESSDIDYFIDMVKEFLKEYMR